jgi:hypothetical protein
MARQRDPRTNPAAIGTENWSSRMPLPDAREGGDSAWDLWHEASLRLDLAFAPTEPSGVGQMHTESGMGEVVVIEERPRFLTVQSVMVVARRNNRVCPHPEHWGQLYEQLGGESSPDLLAPPLQPWLWTKLSGLQKRLRFREHVEWAERHGRLPQVARFMAAMAEGDWVHMGED